jgi:hypothetical protein
VDGSTRGCDRGVDAGLAQTGDEVYRQFLVGGGPAQDGHVDRAREVDRGPVRRGHRDRRVGPGFTRGESDVTQGEGATDADDEGHDQQRYHETSSSQFTTSSSAEEKNTHRAVLSPDLARPDDYR